MFTFHELNNKDAFAYLCQKTSLFQFFDHVYVFGSMINSDAIPNDIDLLLVYSSFSGKIIDEVNSIKESLEQELHIPIDLTVLSQVELKDTHFLKKIGLFKVLK